MPKRDGNRNSEFGSGDLEFGKERAGEGTDGEAELELAPAFPNAEPARTPNSAFRIPKMRCDLCPLGEPGRCPKYKQGRECAYERRETFAELERPENVTLIMRDLLRADLMSFFRAKRIEGMNWKGIDNDAVKLGQALHKGLEAYLELRRRAAGGEEGFRPGDAIAALDAAAAITSSDGELFSEIADPARRGRLVQEYLRLLHREREVLEEVGVEMKDDG